MRGGWGSATSNIWTKGLNMSKGRTFNDVQCCKEIQDQDGGKGIKIIFYIVNHDSIFILMYYNGKCISSSIYNNTGYAFGFEDPSDNFSVLQALKFRGQKPAFPTKHYDFKKKIPMT